LALFRNFISELMLFFKEFGGLLVLKSGNAGLDLTNWDLPFGIGTDLDCILYPHICPKLGWRSGTTQSKGTAGTYLNVCICVVFHLARNGTWK
jgi:hypothetical protein